ncbi:MAG: hypothetical protein DME75_05635 [Verrucomicrobia bacterium]|nr:MAG: hypothetical protein DME75_05635 [Verrucomicrobiota bacterium]
MKNLFCAFLLLPFNTAAAAEKDAAPKFATANPSFGGLILSVVISCSPHCHSGYSTVITTFPWA